MGKNEGHEYILKDLSFQYSDCLPEKRICLTNKTL